MEAISYDKNDFEHLMLISQGHVAFQCLYTGLELGIFDLFSEKGPLNYQEISEELRLNESSCKILIRALYSLNLLNKVNDKFTNSTIAISFLTNKSQLKFKDILGWQSKIVYPGIIDFTDAIKTNSNIGLRHFSGEGDNLYERLSSNKELEMVFQKSMSALSSSANQYFLQHLDLKGINTLVDVGGGEGTNLKAILDRFPNKKGIIFDLDTVCKIANENIKSWHMENQMSTFSGDLFKDNFPHNADMFLFCHMFTIWSGNKIEQILRKCHDALKPGGKVTVFNMVSEDDEKGPISCALGSPYFLTIATGEGKLHTLSEYKEWFKNTGFSRIDIEEGLPFDHKLIVATK